MSDTFDHEGDAWDSLNEREDDDYTGGWILNRRSRSYHPALARPRCRLCSDVCDWARADGRWVLYSHGHQHRCDIKNLFEDVSNEKEANPKTDLLNMRQGDLF